MRCRGRAGYSGRSARYDQAGRSGQASDYPTPHEQAAASRADLHRGHLHLVAIELGVAGDTQRGITMGDPLTWVPGLTGRPGRGGGWRATIRRRPTGAA